MCIDIDVWEKRDDPRHFAPRLIRACNKQKIDWEIEMLGTGDIRFLTASLEIVRIERKSTDADLFTSAAGRLQDQCLRLIEEADVPILLIDGPLQLTRQGSFRAGRFRTQWSYSQITHMLLSLQMRGLHIVYSPSSARTPQVVIDLYKFFQKLEHTSLLEPKAAPFPTNRQGMTPREEKMRVLMAIRGIGSDLAGRLIDVFETPDGVANAPMDSLQLVPGVGKEKAKHIKEVMLDHNLFSH